MKISVRGVLDGDLKVKGSQNGTLKVYYFFLADRFPALGDHVSDFRRIDLIDFAGYE